ncbi:MAG: type II secretion system F family protein [Actinobacteria bacterium]|nr:type II secretion system F family protein [Actinomycetota bacterium]
MGGQPLLLFGAAGVAAAGVMLLLVVVTGGGTPTGVAASLLMIENSVSQEEVGRNELPALDRIVVPLTSKMKGIALRLSPSGTGDRITRLLDLAGNPVGLTLERLLGFKGAGLLLGCFLGIFFGGLSLKGVLFGALGAAAGFMLPDLLLMNTGAKRQEVLRRGLADALDMLTVCVEAGQGFDGAILQVAKSVEGPVAGEFARVLAEIQIGKSRGAAFSSLAARSKVPEIRTFVTALVQADRLGLPIGGVLREQSVQMRLIRRQRAEEKAQKVPVKILLPMLLCIFPALFIVVIGPGVIRMIGAFSSI